MELKSIPVTANRPRAINNANAPLCHVVDDEPGIRQLLVHTLKGLGIRTAEFSRTPDFIAALAGSHPALVFLDVSLENSDAVEAIRGLAEGDFTGMVQLMSGRGSELLEDLRVIGERHGLNMLPPLSKPFRNDTVRRIVRMHLKFSAPAVRTNESAIVDSACTIENIPHWISLEDILANGWFELWYQPKIDLRRKCIVGAEGLARARHPDRGVVPPGAFLPNATADAMRRMTELVLVTALNDWPDFETCEPALRFAVNVPVSALTELSIPAIVREHRPKSERWPGLILEVTEDQIVRDVPLAHEIATQLKIYNVALAIDDFGAGYSHLARLRDLPFAELKIDRHLVANCDTDPTNAALCQTSIDLAHRFGTLAVAEGIERKPEAQALFRMGCDLGQGFLFAPPMPKERFHELMKAQAVQQAS